MELEEFRDWLDSPATKAVLKAMEDRADSLESYLKETAYHSPPTGEALEDFRTAKAKVEALRSLGELPSVNEAELTQTWRDIFDGGTDET